MYFNIFTTYLKFVFFLFIVTSFIPSNANASNTLSAEKIKSGLGIPWGMDFINSSELLVAQKDGEIFILNIKNKKMSIVSGGPVVLNEGQGGLLDVAVSPTFKTTSIVYFTYVKDYKEKAVTTLASAKLINKKLVNFKDIFISHSGTSTSRHFGSRITFDEKGHLFLSIGDRGVRENAQDLSNHAGSIIRLNLDGSIPNDNPFINTKNSLSEIYSYGHRNPQGLFFDKNTQRLWAIEHGPRGGDEINLIQRGKNYGWPIVSHGKEYWAPLAVGEGTHKKGMQAPIKVYIPSIAPSSLLVYSGKIYPKYEGVLVSGALKLRHINFITLDKELYVLKEERLFEDLDQRIRDVIESDEGYIYFSTDQGNIFKVINK